MKSFLQTLFKLRSLIFVFVLAAIASYTGLFQFDNDPFIVKNMANDQMEKPLGFRLEPGDLPFPEFPRKKTTRFSAILNLTGERAGVAIGDFNNDGWEDAIIVSDKFLLLKNNQGQSFSIANDESGLSQFSWLSTASGVAFLDFDNDGWEDLYIARRGRSHFLLKNKLGRFSYFQKFEFTEDTLMPALADINRDGFIDVYLPNRQSPKLIQAIAKNPKKAYSEPMLRNEGGGLDQILINQKGKGFIDQSKELGFRSDRYTWAVGFSDFNNDGFADFYVANDFGIDQVFLNESGLSVKEVSSHSLGTIRSRFSMSAEIADINEDGLADVFVSNTNAAVLRRGFNSLWVNQGGNPPKFVDAASDLGVESCGWGWGAKFTDLDLDGDLDLFVVNGLSREMKTDFPFWYYLIFNRGIPQALKDMDLIGLNTVDGIGMASGQPSCVYLNENGVYRDVSSQLNLMDKYSSRGLASFDFDKDGLTDFLIGNSGKKPTFYKTKINEMKSKWIGLKLVGTHSNRDAIGARVTFKFKGKTIVREIFPTNGYYSQSSKNLVVAVPENQNPSVEIRWPSGRTQMVANLIQNQYHTIIEE